MDPDLASVAEPLGPFLPTMEIIESKTTSLIGQDLLHGFISHKSARFAITGSKTAGALAAGFPNVWTTISSKMKDEVPGWVQEMKTDGAATAKGLQGPRGAGPGMVVNLSGARPAGAGP